MLKDLWFNAKQTYRKNARLLLAVSFAFTIVLIAAIVLNAALPGSGFLSVPLVVLPLLFCLQIAFSRLQQEGQLELKEFNHFYVLGLSGKFRRSYRALSSFLKATLLFIVLIFVFGIIAGYVVPLMNPAFGTLSEEFMAMAADSSFDYAAMIAFLNEHLDVFMPVANVISCLALAFASLYFFGALAANMMAVHFALTSPGDGRFVVFTHRAVMLEIRGEFRKLFLGMAWPSLLLYLFGFAAGSVLAWFSFDDYWMIANFGMILGVLFVWPTLPILLSGEEQLYRKFAGRYAFHMTMQFKNLVNDLSSYKDLNSEEEAEIAELKKQAAELEKKLAESETPPSENKKADDSSKDSNPSDKNKP